MAFVPSKLGDGDKMITIFEEDHDDVCGADDWVARAFAATYQELMQFQDTSKLHPALLGQWQTKHGGLTISETTLKFWGDEPRLVERLAPYCFIVEHEWGSSMFTLRPSLNEMDEVNYKDGTRHYWVKC